ncbi:helix-turn-helix transcriptional regulator [Geothrix sp. 21YS21S-4]|uniref:ArsR/SmtB family transcription factor n=1 Tax=Geothrix sp. 21YS21S-4 TaxID=3068889 RepID=UPI0027B93CF8|nr:metalloregulator ArsR/SmtB family transcription factor [Geothrix sp. 21YS21S-4]
MPHQLSNPMIEEVSGLFSAMGDVSRLKILRALLEADGALSQGTVAEAAGLSQANASKHLACLVRVGLVSREPEGNAVYFTPAMPLVGELCDLVCGHVTARARVSYKALK